MKTSVPHLYAQPVPDSSSQLQAKFAITAPITMLSGMGRNSAVCFLIAAAVTLVSGCDSVSGLDTDEKTTTSASTTAAPSTTTIQSTVAPSSSAPSRTSSAPGRTSSVPTSGVKPAALPTCSIADAGTPPPDCEFSSTDTAALTFEVHRTGSDMQGAFTIDVLTADGTTAQTITEQNVQIDRAPHPLARDTDADGRDELLVPLTVGPYWTEYAVYHATGKATDFTRAGEFTGLSIESTPDGYTVTSAKLPDNKGWSYKFWTYESDKLVPLATAELNVTTENGRKTTQECTLVSAPGLTRTPFSTLTEARTHFCTQPPIAP